MNNEWRHFEKGAENPNARFNPEEREEIKQRVARGEGVRQIAREKGAAPSTISRIAKEKKSDDHGR
ncbi:MAG TPA: helix-turn-helix domain-containing protein [Gemmatimonadales bacterium]|nr:helix-turn-helix domain-containing protein [Gemmatimonadales bacterium]